MVLAITTTIALSSFYTTVSAEHFALAAIAFPEAEFDRLPTTGRVRHRVIVITFRSHSRLRRFTSAEFALDTLAVVAMVRAI